MTLLQPNAKAPDFTLEADTGSKLSLSTLSGKPVVLFFYPKADTPGCTLESQAFSTLKKDFDKLGVTVWGISADEVSAQCAFRDKYGLSVPLLSDPDHIALNAYGVWGEKKNYGKTYMGIIRSTFLIGPDGNIAKTWKVARTKGHAEQVLEHAQSLYG